MSGKPSLTDKSAGTAATKPKKRLAKAKSNPLKNSPLSVAFKAIKPHWRCYLDFVAIAASDGDKAMRSIMDVYTKLPAKEQNSIMPEELCIRAQVSTHTLLGAVCAMVSKFMSANTAMIAATSYPLIMEKLVKGASNIKFGNRDRELYLRAMGALPDRKGMSINVTPVINTNSNNVHNGNNNSIIAVPDMASQMVDFEQGIPYLPVAKAQPVLTAGNGTIEAEFVSVPVGEHVTNYTVDSTPSVLTKNYNA